MEYLSAKQITPEILLNTEYDIFILSSGYEQRSIYLPLNYTIKAKNKIALAFKEKHKELNRKNNDSYLVSQGFNLINISGDQNVDMKAILTNCSLNSTEKISILIDYSSMTKVWYAGIINYLISATKICNYVEVHFSYTPALYTDLNRIGPVKVNSTVSYAYKKANQFEKPTALLIGLGLEKSHANFIQKTLNPALTLLLYADPSTDLKYVEKVFNNNRELIEDTEVRNLYSFPLNDLEQTNEVLTNLCLSLRTKYNIVIAPVGPKVLSLLALLLASRFPDINVVRISSGSSASVYDRVPCNVPLIYSAEFVSDDLEY